MSSQKGKKKLIVGLGNPGKRYEQTRHNIGFVVGQAFVQQSGMRFRRSLRNRGKIAKGLVDEISVVLLLPTTNMNRSGAAVKRCLRLHQIAVGDLLVIVDDVDLPFGNLRMREKGSAGGHNGLKSIEEAVGNREYPRLKVGISDRTEGELKDYVLGRFSPEEKDQLPGIIQRAVDGINIWAALGIQEAMKNVNLREKTHVKNKKPSLRGDVHFECDLE